MPFLGALAGVGLGLPRYIETTIHYTFKGTVWNPSIEPLPPATNYYGIPMVSLPRRTYAAGRVCFPLRM